MLWRCVAEINQERNMGFYWTFMPCGFVKSPNFLQIWTERCIMMTITNTFLLQSYSQNKQWDLNMWETLLTTRWEDPHRTLSLLFKSCLQSADYPSEKSSWLNRFETTAGFKAMRAEQMKRWVQSRRTKLDRLHLMFLLKSSFHATNQRFDLTCLI